MGTRDGRGGAEDAFVAQAVAAPSITVTAAYEPRARSSEAHTKSGALRKEARQWRDGLAWSAKLQALGSRLALEPPYEVTVDGYFPPEASQALPSPQDWFECIATALGEALGVDPAEIRVKPGRVGYTPPFSPAHFKIVITSTDSGVSVPLDPRVAFPACALQSKLGPDAQSDVRCPPYGHDGGRVHF